MSYFVCFSAICFLHPTFYPWIPLFIQFLLLYNISLCGYTIVYLFIHSLIAGYLFIVTIKLIAGALLAPINRMFLITPLRFYDTPKWLGILVTFLGIRNESCSCFRDNCMVSLLKTCFTLSCVSLFLDMLASPGEELSRWVWTKSCDPECEPGPVLIPGRDPVIT